MTIKNVTFTNNETINPDLIQSFKIICVKMRKIAVTRTEINIGSIISSIETSKKLIEYRWIIGKIANKNGWIILVLGIINI